MMSKCKGFFSTLVKLFLVFYCILTYVNTASSSTTPPKNIPSSSLYLPTASLAAYGGLGAAAPGDYSSADVNPAIMSAFKKQYNLFGDTSWKNYDNLISGGILDNATTEIATLVRVRETVPNDNDSRDRRFTLGLSYQLPKTRLSLGVSFDYEQLALSNLTSANNSNFFAGTGLLYEYVTNSGRHIFFGAGINRIFDEFTPILYDTGISTTFFDGFYSLSLDALTSHISGLQKIVGSVSVAANQFLDLKGSYGYMTQAKKNTWGAGIFFHAPIVQLFYTFASSDSDDTTGVRQSAGCAFNFSF